jgi:hypothetical protein
MRILSAFLVCCVLVSGCVSYRPRPIEEVPFRSRALTQAEDDLTVTVAVPSRDEAEKIFGVRLYDKGIQPVWLQIENQSRKPHLLLLAGMDPNYYPPAEAAFASRFSTTGRLASYGILTIIFFPFIVPGLIELWSASSANAKMDADFAEKALPRTLLEGGQSVAGFVFTDKDPGTKHVQVPLFGAADTKRFDFYVPVPGIRTDYQTVDFDALYPEDLVVDYEDEGDLREAIRSLPCCTTNEKGNETGDPLNLVFVGEFEQLLAALTHARWDETEVIYAGSAWRTVKSFLLGHQYRASPMSKLYFDGRDQDVAFQKARGTIHQRHHFRVWATPIRYRGSPIWVGAATRDIGVKFTTKTWTLTTHAIDPDVDDARDYILVDLIESAKALSTVALAAGVGAASEENPKRTLTGDPWYTDGRRAVMFLADEPTERPALVEWNLQPAPSPNSTGKE